MKKIFLSILKALAVFIFWIAIWLLVSKQINNGFLFPSPKETCKALAALIVTKDFWLTTILTLGRIVLGIMISLVIGCLLAVVTSVSALLRALLAPFMNAVKSVPVACFIMLALLWMNTSMLPVFITALIVVPIVWSNVSQGISSTDKKLLEIAKIYKFSASKKLLKIYVPSVMPYFLAACRSAFGMAWKAGIAAEVLAVPKQAIGTEIYFSKLWFDTPVLFAWTVIIIILSYVIEKLLILGIETIAKKTRLIKKGDQYVKA